MYTSKLIKILIIIPFAIELKGSGVIANDNTEENIIIRICKSSLKKEMNDAGEKVTPGIANYTCNCFYNKVNLGASIKSAQEICKKNALKKYKLNTL